MLICLTLHIVELHQLKTVELTFNSLNYIDNEYGRGNGLWVYHIQFLNRIQIQRHGVQHSLQSKLPLQKAFASDSNGPNGAEIFLLNAAINALVWSLATMPTPASFVLEKTVPSMLTSYQGGSSGGHLDCSSSLTCECFRFAVWNSSM